MLEEFDLRICIVCVFLRFLFEENVMSNQVSRLACAAMVVVASGCSRGPSVESYHPEQDTALEALTSALTAWQNGQTPDELKENTDPEVQIAEPVWDAGSKLKNFEIVEALPGDTPRKFSVKLTLEGASAPEDVTYVVVGKDPLWVMREKEYERGDM
jgi:hypothetical protein